STGSWGAAGDRARAADPATTSARPAAAAIRTIGIRRATPRLRVAPTYALSAAMPTGHVMPLGPIPQRSEERRVGKEWRCRRPAAHEEETRGGARRVQQVGAE